MDDDQYKRILAIDYGAKRIGLALSDPLLTFAYPYKTILNNDKTWRELDDLVKEKNIQKVVLGFPFREGGKESSISGAIKKFKETLEKRYKFEVILWDERYTSSIASDMMIESVNKKNKRRDKGILDRNAAAIILGEFLEENRLKGKS